MSEPLIAATPIDFASIIRRNEAIKLLFTPEERAESEQNPSCPDLNYQVSNDIAAFVREKPDSDAPENPARRKLFLPGEFFLEIFALATNPGEEGSGVEILRVNNFGERYRILRSRPDLEIKRGLYTVTSNFFVNDFGNAFFEKVLRKGFGHYSPELTSQSICATGDQIRSLPVELRNAAKYVPSLIFHQRPVQPDRAS